MTHLATLIHWPPPGRYLVAVSGGADSMTLLHLLAANAAARGYHPIVGHVDHGLRAGSAADRHFVQAAADRYRLPFDYHEARLGRASEATARRVRYDWLQQARRHHNAAAVITAHHQDDLIETSLLNLARGTGRRGLAPMQSGPIDRPLLGVSRADLRAYAVAHHLTWRDDPTNADTTNPRNRLRHHLLPHATPAWRTAYLTCITKLSSLNTEIDQTLDQLLSPPLAGDTSCSLPRPLVRDLSLPELEELLIAAAHRIRPDFEPNRRLVQELALFAKTAPPHRRRPLSSHLHLVVSPNSVSLTTNSP